MAFLCLCHVSSMTLLIIQQFTQPLQRITAFFWKGLQEHKYIYTHTQIYEMLTAIYDIYSFFL